MDLTTAYLLIIPAVIILLLVFPIFVELRISFNPLENRGVIALFVFRKKIFYYFIEIHGRYITLVNDKETKTEELQFDSPQFAIIEEFTKQVKDKVRLKNIYVFYNIGTGDAFTSSLLCGLFNQVLNFIFVNLKSKKPTASLCIYGTVSYNRLICEVAVTGKVSISLFDIVYSFLYSVIITKRTKEYNI